MQARRRHTVAFAVACLQFLVGVSRAAAGPVEQLVQVALHPSDPDTMMLRYVNGGEGLLVSHDGGATWGLVCNGFIDPTSAARGGVVALANDGSMLLGVFGGVWQGDAQGCGWELDSGVGPRWVTDLAQDPSDPDTLYAVTANGGEGVRNGILKRDADGNWSELGTPDEVMVFRMFVVQNGHGRRFVQSATRGMLTRTVGGLELTVPNYLIRVSDDEGASWQELPFAAPDDGTFYLVAVDPGDPDRMLAYVDRDESRGVADRVLVSSDGGQTFTVYLEVTDFGGAAILPDGTVFIGDRGTPYAPDLPLGLWTAPSLEQPATSLEQRWAVGCLAYSERTDTLFACGLRDFGVLDRESGELATTMTLGEVQSLVECEGQDVVAGCEAQLCRAYCGYGHFASAPACQVYDSPSCGRGVATAAGDSGVAPGASLASVDAGSAAVPPDPAAGGDAAADAVKAKDADPQADDGPRRYASPCAAANVGSDPSRAPAAAAALWLTWLARRLRRRSSGSAGAQRGQRSGSASSPSCASW